MNNIFFEIGNYPLLESDAVKVRDFLYDISFEIFKHEIKNEKKHTRTIFRVPSIDNIRFKKINNKKYYYYFTNVFYEIIAGNAIIDAAKKYPDLFGSGNSEDVILALNKVRPSFSESNVDALFKDEQYCFIFEEDYKGELNKDKVLKIQLFRFQEVHKKNGNSDDNKEFVGGLLHTFQHFSFTEMSLSTFDNGYNLNYHPSFFILDLTNAFFNTELSKTKDKDGKEGLLGVYNGINFFFFSVDTIDLKVCFLSTAYFLPKIKNTKK